MRSNLQQKYLKEIFSIKTIYLKFNLFHYKNKEKYHNIYFKIDIISSYLKIKIYSLQDMKMRYYISLDTYIESEWINIFHKYSHKMIFIYIKNYLL